MTRIIINASNGARKMRLGNFILLSVSAFASSFELEGEDGNLSPKEKPLIVAHYMSWFQTPEFSGSWGFWRIQRDNIDKKYWHEPENRKDCGARDISSVFYPDIGPYDSADPDLCEYHILLAKLAGIDAFVADWYGPDPSKEHPYDNIGFLAMKKMAEKMNFKVMICWEDRSMFPKFSPGVKSREDALDRGREMLKYLESEWFSSPAYLRLGKSPMLTNFCWGDPGDDISKPFLSAAEWREILSSSNEKIVFVHDYHLHRKVNDFTPYSSVLPWGCNYHGRDSAPEFWKLCDENIEKGDFSFTSGTVLPDFDNRGCGGWHNHETVCKRRNGDKFRANWEEVLKHNPALIHIPTWNDFNEGGTIEPVRQGILQENFPGEGYGCRELETVQTYAEKLGKIKADKAALKIPRLIYSCRKLIQKNAPENKNLPLEIDRSVSLLIEGKTKESEALAKSVNASFPDSAKSFDLLTDSLLQ